MALGLIAYFVRVDPRVARAQDISEEAWQVARELYDQGAGPTTCAAKLERHFDLTAKQTAEILTDIYPIDVRPCAEALEAVYGEEFDNAAQICSACPFPSSTYLDEATTPYRRPRWMGALDDEGLCDDGA